MKIERLNDRSFHSISIGNGVQRNQEQHVTDARDAEESIAYYTGNPVFESEDVEYDVEAKEGPHEHELVQDIAHYRECESADLDAKIDPL